MPIEQKYGCRAVSWCPCTLLSIDDRRHITCAMQTCGALNVAKALSGDPRCTTVKSSKMLLCNLK